jgi:hypothetical protein
MSISTTWPPAALDAADDTAEEMAAGTDAELPLPEDEPQPAARPTLTTAAMTSPKPACGRPLGLHGRVSATAAGLGDHHQVGRFR